MSEADEIKSKADPATRQVGLDGVEFLPGFHPASPMSFEV